MAVDTPPPSIGHKMPHVEGVKPAHTPDEMTALRDEEQSPPGKLHYLRGVLDKFQVSSFKLKHLQRTYVKLPVQILHVYALITKLPYIKEEKLYEKKLFISIQYRSHQLHYLLLPNHTLPPLRCCVLSSQAFIYLYFVYIVMIITHF